MRKTVCISVAAALALGVLSLCGCSSTEESPSTEEGAISTEVKPEVTDEEILEGLQTAFIGVPTSEFIEMNNKEIIDYLIQNGYNQKLEQDGSGYWANIYNIYYIKDKDGNPLSPSAASQADKSDTYVSIATSFPIFEPATLEMLMKQVSGADEIVGYREKATETGTNAVGVAVIDENEYLVTAQRPDNLFNDCIVDVYLGGMSSDARLIAEQYPL